ncbi:MAG: YihY/virulence factor BrkB family protein [Chloroflexi bacterium]|nr:MAG: YihY/virulence factor BrkB family protein [Chloroflexota bacterium]
MNLEGLKQSVPGKLGQKFVEDQSPNWAVLIAWNALFAMFPIVLFAASILGLVLRVFGQANAKIYNTIFAVIPDDHSRTQVINAVTGVKHQTGILFVVGLIGLLWGGSALFGAMEQAFAVIYHTLPRDFIRQKLIGFGMVLVFTVLAGVAVGSSAVLPALKHIPGVPTALTGGILAALLQIVLGVVSGFILFASIYFVIPNRRQEWGKVWPGALVAGIAFELVTLIFPLYLTVNKGINQYGATFGLMFLLMTFFYFIGLIAMLGVEFNAVLFPVPVEQPSRRGEPGRTAVSAPPQSGPEGEGLAWSPKPSPKQVQPAAARRAPANQDLPARVPAFLIFLGSAVAGLLVGRRAAGGAD